MNKLESSGGVKRDGAPRFWSRWLVIGLLSVPVLLAAGVGGAVHFGRMADAELREELLYHATSIAGTIGVEAAEALSFTAADRDNPHFQRLRVKMMAYAEAVGLRSLYSMAWRDGRIVFGPESLAEDDPYASPPGTVYEMPSEADLDFFQNCQPVTIGPQTDEYGALVSALAPVLDPRTGDLLLAIGVDMEAKAWRAAVNRARLVPLLFTLLMLAILLGGLALLGRRDRRPAESCRWLRHAEAMLAAVVGLELSLAAAWLARDTELRSRRNGFQALARAQSSILMEDLRDLRSRLNTLARFFEASEYVDRDEFRHYAEPLTRDGLCQSWVWIPSVTADAVADVEAEARRDGLADFAIWQRNVEGARVPVAGREVYFPAFYITSLSGQENDLGYDMGSEPIRRAALDEVARSGLATATDPVALFALPDQPPGILVFQAASSRRQNGFVAVTVRPDTLVRLALRRSGGREVGLAVDLFQLEPGQAPRSLAGFSPDHAGGTPCWSSGFGATFPAFVFGKTYGIVVHPLPGWLAAHPARGGWVLGLVGLLFTAVLTVFIGFLTRRRAALEKEVRARTAELQAKSDELGRFFSSALDLLCIADTEGYFRRLNNEWEKTLGYALDELVGRKFMDFVHPEDRAETLKAMTALREGREVLNYVNRFVCKDGTHRWIEWKAVPSGQLIYFSARDITERKRSEEALRTSEERFGQVAESAEEWIWEQDAEGLYTYSSPVVEQILGYKPEELVGKKHFYDLFAPYVREGLKKAAFERSLRKEAFRKLANPVVRKDGRVVILETSGVPILDREGRLAGYRGADTDITERRRAEEALRALSARQEALLSAVPDIIMEVDTRKVYTWANRAGYDFFGEDVIGKEAAFYFEGEQKTYEAVQPLFNGEENVIYVESRQRRRDGQKRLLAWWCRVLKDENGKVVGALSTARDITEQKTLEEQLRQALKIEAVGRLAGGVAHDFNNMLSVILGHAEMAMEQSTPEQPIHENLLEIQKAAQRSATLTRQLLAFARKQTVSPRVLDLNETVSGMLKMLRRLIGEGIELVWNPGADLWPVRMDPVQVDQLLANMAVNARDAIADIGTLTVETENVTLAEPFCKTHPEAGPGEYVLLEVSDTGAGMDRATIEHIFEPFFTTKDIGQGTGLGLATVYGIIRQNNGFITVDSRPGQGSIFRLYLPRASGPDLAEPAAERKKTKPGTETVLLVEDFSPLVRLCKNILDRSGYQVLTAGTPGEALAVARRHKGPIHILITDVIMPEMNGRELANQIQPLRPEMKILYMSGYTADLITGYGMLGQGIHFLQKPFSVEAFAGKVRAVLDG